MEFIALLAAFSQTTLFQIRTLNERKLQEKGITPLATMYALRLAIIPASIFLVCTFKWSYLEFFIDHKTLLLHFFMLVSFWGIAHFLVVMRINSTSSLTFLLVFKKIIEIPLWLVTGIFINGDIPNGMILLALSFFVLALLVRPNQHFENNRTLFSRSLMWMILVSIIISSIHAVNLSLYRELLTETPFFLFTIALFLFCTMGLLNIIFLLFPLADVEKEKMKKWPRIVYAIPVFWFLGSIPEGIGYFLMPIYTMAVLGAFGFLIFVCSDLYNKRLIFNFRMALFMGFTISAIIFAGFSL